MFTTSKRGKREVDRGRAGARLTFLHCADARPRPASSSAAAGVRPSAYAFFPSVVKLLRQRLRDFFASNTLAFARFMQPLTH